MNEGKKTYVFKKLHWQINLYNYNLKYVITNYTAILFSWFIL